VIRSASNLAQIFSVSCVYADIHADMASFAPPVGKCNIVRDP